MNSPGKGNPQRLENLKLRALEILQEQGQSRPGAASASPVVEKCLEELSIYQIELELQNEELRVAQRDAEFSRRRYHYLFEQMPAPALVLQTEGLIKECNLWAQDLLGARKSMAIPDNRLFLGLREHDQARLRRALRDLKEGADTTVVERLMLLDGGQQKLVFDAHLVVMSIDFHLDPHVLLLMLDRSAEITRERERHFFSLLLDSSDNLISAVDSQGKVLVANQAWLTLLGRSHDQVLGHARGSALPLRQEILHRGADQTVLSTGAPFVFEERLDFGASQSGIDLITRKFPIRDPQGQVYGVGSISTDISEIKARQRLSVLSESVFQKSSEAIIVTDEHTRIVRVNPAFTRQSGFSETSVIGECTNILKSGRHDSSFYSGMWRDIKERGSWSGEICNRTAAGKYYAVWSTITSVTDEHGNVVNYFAIQTDMTALHAVQSEVRHLASYDSLTGLPNRSHFSESIKQLIAFARRRKTRFALLFIDLDRFKEVNDSLGHHVGDELLEKVATRLKDSIREEDTVARMGGDEFVVLLPATDRAQAEVVAHNLLARLRVPMTLEQSVLYQPMASIGIAVFPEDGDTPDLLTRNADLAMYEAKMMGRNCTASYKEKMSADNTYAFAIQTELASAIKRDELRVYYQPKFALDSGLLVGAEALVRWERPNHGLVLPADFIPIAIRTGLLVEIDRWVLKETLQQVGQWRRSGLWSSGMRICVNQHASDLQRPDMISHLQMVLETMQVDASMLELEITEDALLDHTQELIEQLKALTDLGIVLAIDDFGTGYSSLSYLGKLPVSVLKIDRSFVSNMLINDEDRILVETIILMAHKLHHELVAEGVMEPAQRAALVELGCEVGQGDLFGKPVPAQQFFSRYLCPADSTDQCVEPS